MSITAALFGGYPYLRNLILTGNPVYPLAIDGVISLPVMLRYGYSTELSTGVITAAGTLGQIIPPSVVLVVLALTANVIAPHDPILVPMGPCHPEERRRRERRIPFENHHV